MCLHAKFHGNRLNFVRHDNFSIFQYGSRHLGFSKCGNFRVGRVKAAKMHLWAKFLVDRVKQLLRYGDFSIFQDGGRRHLGFSEGGNFKGGKGQEGQNASSCKISRRSVKLLLRHGHFSIFQDGDRRHLGFSKGGNFRGGNSQGGQSASLSHISHRFGQTIAEIWRLFDFSKMAAVRHLGYVMRVFGPPTNGIWWFYHCAKFGWNRGSSFDKYACFSISSVWLENRLFTPQKLVFFGIWPPKWEGISTKPPNGTSLRERRHMTYRSSKSVHRCDLCAWQRHQKRKKDKARNLTVANWVFAQTTHIVRSKWNFAWWVVFRC